MYCVFISVFDMNLTCISLIYILLSRIHEYDKIISFNKTRAGDLRAVEVC